MANNLELKRDGPCKGISFIDSDCLDKEDFERIDRIINTPCQTSAVQFPFLKGNLTFKKEVLGQKQAVVSAKTVVLPVVTSAPPTAAPTMPAPSTAAPPPAPVITPFTVPITQPPPGVAPVSFPMSIPWTQATVEMASHSNGAAYPMPLQGGYVYPNPALPVGCEAGTVAFVTTINGGHPLYAMPGHGLPPHFQGAHIGHRDIPLTIPYNTPMTDTMIPPPMLPLHAVPPPIVSSDLPNSPLTAMAVPPPHSGIPIPPHQAVPVGIPPPGIPVAPTQQVVYIPQPIIEPEHSVTATFNSTVIEETHVCENENVVVVDEKAGGDYTEVVVKDTNVSEVTNSNTIDISQTNSLGNEVDVNVDVVVDVSSDNGVTIVSTSEITNNDCEDLKTDIKEEQPSFSIESSEVTVEDDKNDSNAQTEVKIEINPEVKIEINTEATVEVVPVSPPTPSSVPAQPSVKSWSSLFAKTSSISPVAKADSQPVSPPKDSHIDPQAFPTIGAPYTKEANIKESAARSRTITPDKVTSVGVHNDPLAYRILDQINDMQIIHSPIVIQPRGLKNGQNTCFLNAPLQVLMGCPPFVHMFRSFRHIPSRTGKSSTPVLDSLVQFVNSFQNGQRLRTPGSKPKKFTQADLNVGQPFIPEPVLDVAQDIFGLNIGVQHDAEEFLSQILSICNEEMENLLKMDVKNFDNEKEVEVKEINGGSNGQDVGLDDEEDDAWQQVGPKNHHVETNVNDCRGKTPLSSIFAGLSRSCMVRETGKSSDTVDSFFTLKLDIQSENIYTVKDALLRLNSVETLHDADGRKIHGQRRMFFDVLPHVLIMHLKLFEYANGNGQKIQKNIKYDVDLQIPKEIISRVGKSRYASAKSRNYKLFGVVNHHGVKMNDGHYTSDVFLAIASGWLRFDDSQVTVIEEADVLQHTPRSMPYLLFYRRMDCN